MPFDNERSEFDPARAIAGRAEAAATIRRKPIAALLMLLAGTLILAVELLLRFAF